MIKHCVILSLNLILVSCFRTENKKMLVLSSKEKTESINSNYLTISSNEINKYSQEEIKEMLYNKSINNQLLFDSNLIIYDTIKIVNTKTRKVSSIPLLYNNKELCTLNETSLNFILNNFYFNYGTDSYHIILKNNQLKITYDSTNIHHSCLASGYNSKMLAYKIILNKSTFTLGDTLKCRAFIIQQGKSNNSLSDSNIYLYDSIDAKYIVN